MARTIDIPQEALEMAYTVQDQFPGMAVEDIALELIIQGVESQKRKQEARKQAIETLPKLSPDALEYVVKPIEWARPGQYEQRRYYAVPAHLPRP